jgi:hypothetical protein
MHRFLIAVLFFFILISCNTSCKKDKQISVRIMQVEKLDRKNFENLEGTFYSVKIAMINNTDTVFSFWSMTCSWELTWITNSRKFSLLGRNCDINFPILRKINPGKELVFNGIIISNDTILQKGQNIVKLGFILIKENEYNKTKGLFFVVMEKFEEKDHTLWSNPIELRE